MSPIFWMKPVETERTVGVHHRQPTRWEDLDGAYNDGELPAKMTRLQQFTQYGIVAWVATLILIAAYYGLIGLWNLFSGPFS